MSLESYENSVSLSDRAVSLIFSSIEDVSELYLMSSENPEPDPEIEETGNRPERPGSA